ncbi:hypothetical protein RIF29_03682 [Crotalaria pallida]|uniref:Uncharacterized protein n=1 Tax=Crotalaria pallida TaxID=3830 RepID=A0AAN9J0E7_CROPI
MDVESSPYESIAEQNMRLLASTAASLGKIGELEVDNISYFIKKSYVCVNLILTIYRHWCPFYSGGISGGGEKVGAQTETELKEKKLRVEDALNATKAAVEEGIIVGGGCTLLRIASKMDEIKDSLDNDEEKVGADIVKRALSYPLKLIAKNAGVNGCVVSEKVLSSDNPKYGYNAATGKYKDLMAVGIIDPTKYFEDCQYTYYSDELLNEVKDE